MVSLAHIKYCHTKEQFWQCNYFYAGAYFLYNILTYIHLCVLGLNCKIQMLDVKQIKINVLESFLYRILNSAKCTYIVLKELDISPLIKEK